MDQVTYIEKYLRKIDYIIRKEGRGILSDLNITVPQFTALQILINNGDQTISELSQNMALACSTITDLIDRMEKTGLVIRKKDEKDKRITRVEVLPQGYDILDKVLTRRKEFLNLKLTDFNNEEKEVLSNLLGKLFEAMNQ